jgi:ferredoxin-NADP reductase
LDADILRRHRPAEYARLEYFVCGPEAMMDAVEEALKQVGVPAARVHSELLHHGLRGPTTMRQRRSMLTVVSMSVGAAELAAVPLSPHKFHGDWIYTIAQSVNR